jgi:broad specificity phosphatase PhoE
MLILHIVFALIVAAFLAKAVSRLFAPNRPKVIIITSHNNAILGYLQYYSSVPLPKTVLPNGAVVKIVVRNGVATFSLLTSDGDHDKFFKKGHILATFPTPVPFAAPNCVIYLVRHGESHANVGISHTNPMLTPTGIQDAVRAGEAIASDLEGSPQIILVSSPLPRTVQTMDVIKPILGTTTSTVLDISGIESSRDVGRPIHTRGPTAVDATIIACDPRLPLNAYRDPHICNPTIEQDALEKMVSPNRLPPSFDYPGTCTELLMRQLATDEWPRLAALTPLHEIVAFHI